jgi:hypothetical protein
LQKAVLASIKSENPFIRQDGKKDFKSIFSNDFYNEIDHHQTLEEYNFAKLCLEKGWFFVFLLKIVFYFIFGLVGIDTLNAVFLCYP